jgi:hypothetical protein
MVIMSKPYVFFILSKLLSLANQIERRPVNKTSRIVRNMDADTTLTNKFQLISHSEGNARWMLTISLLDDTLETSHY